MELMLKQPEEMATVAGTAVVVIQQLQNNSSVWESLLVVPQLFQAASVDQVLGDTENLLTNIER